MRADGCCRQKVECATVGMGKRKERKYFISLFEQFGTNAESDVAGKVVAGQHDSFAETGSTGSIVQEHYFIVGEGSVLHIFAGKSFRITGMHLFIGILQKLLYCLSVTLIQATEVGQ